MPVFDQKRTLNFILYSNNFFIIGHLHFLLIPRGSSLCASNTQIPTKVSRYSQGIGATPK